MKLRIATMAVSSCLMTSAALAQGPRGSCTRVEVSSASTATRGPGSTALRGMVSTPRPALPRFAVTSIVDLTFTVLFPSRTAGAHLVELRVFTPDAQLYRSLSFPVADSRQASLTRSVAGYPRPLPQQPLVRGARGRSLLLAASTAFPVAGTDIVSSGLYGRWRVEAYLDGAEQRCAPAAWFTLYP
jgi:hypothetical protein